MQEGNTHVESQCPRAIDLLITVYAHKRVSALVQGAFETDHDKLEGIRSLRADIVCNFRDIRVVESCVDLVEDEKWCRLIAVFID